MPPSPHAAQPPVRLVRAPRAEARALPGRRARRARRRTGPRVEARVCLAFPDVYDIGMSHLGFKILYKILNDDPRTLAERAYAPVGRHGGASCARAGLPLVSCESARPLRDFDVVGFSLQFELTYTNVLMMLDLGRHPAAGERPRRGRSARHRRRPHGHAPRAARALPRRVRRSATARSARTEVALVVDAS